MRVPQVILDHSSFTTLSSHAREMERVTAAERAQELLFGVGAPEVAGE